MRSPLLLALLCACSSAHPAGRLRPQSSALDELACDESVSSPIVFTPQQATNWCWAAVSNMVASAYGDVARQCELASIVTGRADCCDPGANSRAECNVQAAPLAVLRDVYAPANGHFSLTYEQLLTRTMAGRQWQWHHSITTIHPEGC